jgi:hypothetical protein
MLKKEVSIVSAESQFWAVFEGNYALVIRIIAKIPFFKEEVI